MYLVALWDGLCVPLNLSLLWLLQNVRHTFDTIAVSVI